MQHRKRRPGGQPTPFTWCPSEGAAACAAHPEAVLLSAASKGLSPPAFRHGGGEHRMHPHSIRKTASSQQTPWRRSHCERGKMASRRIHRLGRKTSPCWSDLPQLGAIEANSRQIFCAQLCGTTSVEPSPDDPSRAPRPALPVCGCALQYVSAKLEPTE